MSSFIPLGRNPVFYWQVLYFIVVLFLMHRRMRWSLHPVSDNVLHSRRLQMLQVGLKS